MESYYMIELDYFDAEMLRDNRFNEVEEKIVNFLQNSGKLVSLSISGKEAIIWVILKAYSEEEVIKTMNSIEVGYDFSYDYYFINHYEVVQEMSSFSLN